MADQPYNLLFLCTGNSARSIMAECALNRWGQGRFKAYSAGSHPRGQVHPMTLQLLRDYNFLTDSLRSKDWSEFAKLGAPPLDFVFTVCDDAANEVCPVWPGQPMTAHWGIEDPAAFVGGDEKTYAFFKRVYSYLDNRIKIFVSLPIAGLDRLPCSAGSMRSARRHPRRCGLRSPMTDVTIYHNPACGTSRNVLGLIRNSGIEPGSSSTWRPRLRAPSLSTDRSNGHFPARSPSSEGNPLR